MNTNHILHCAWFSDNSHLPKSDFSCRNCYLIIEPPHLFVWCQRVWTLAWCPSSSLKIVPLRCWAGVPKTWSSDFPEISRQYSESIGIPWSLKWDELMMCDPCPPWASCLVLRLRLAIPGHGSSHKGIVGVRADAHPPKVISHSQTQLASCSGRCN